MYLWLYRLSSTDTINVSDSSTPKAESVSVTAGSGRVLTFNIFFTSSVKVSEPAEKLCSESVQPYLGSVLEELMEPISCGFQEGRQLSETMMDRVCQDVLLQGDKEKLKKVCQ